MDCTESPAPSKASPTRLLITPNSGIAEFLGTCPHASTLFAWSATQQAYIVAALTCRRWACAYCGRRKITSLAARTREASPNRLITLTCDTKLYLSPRDAFDRTRRKVGDFVKLVRKAVGEFEFLRVLEATKRGWPHYHFVARCPFIPQAQLSTFWATLTGNIIVDVRAIDKATNAYWYVVKYLAKQTHVQWTTRRVSTSRKFFVERDRTKDVTLSLHEKQRFLAHPARWIDENCQGQTLQALTAGCWAIDPTTGQPDPDQRQIEKNRALAAERERRRP